MRTNIISIFAIIFLAITSFAQETKQDKKGAFQINAYAGKPIGYLNSHSDFNAGFSIGYLTYVNNIVRVGGSIGYDHSTVKSDSSIKNHSTFEFLMIGATAEMDVIDNFYIGADLGLAFKVDPKTMQSHYFTPKIGYRFTDNINVYTHYKGVRYSGYQVASFGIGASFDF